MLGIEDYGSDSDNDHTTDVTESSATNTTSVTTKQSQRLALPPSNRKHGPKKITIGLPNFKTSRDSPDNDENNDQPPAAKKPRTGSGVSSLLSMLPPPKKVAPERPPGRVLGAGNGSSLVFSQLSTSVSSNASEADITPLPLFTPASLGKRKANISVEEDHRTLTTPPVAQTVAGLNFFSLGTSAHTFRVTHIYFIIRL